jgi:hypothetical protein
MLDTLLQTNHTALLRPHALDQISNKCTYLILGASKTLFDQTALLGLQILNEIANQGVCSIVRVFEALKGSVFFGI